MISDRQGDMSAPSLLPYNLWLTTLVTDKVTRFPLYFLPLSDSVPVINLNKPPHCVW